MPTIPSVTEAVDMPLYDTVALAGRSNDLFIVPVGAQGKTLKETNLTNTLGNGSASAGILPPPERLTVMRFQLSMFYADASFVALDHPVWKSVVFFQKDSRMYVKELAFTLAHPVCVLKDSQKFLDLRSSDQEALISNLNRKLICDIPIQSLEPFRGEILCDKPYPDIKCWMGLYGVKERPL